jgi:hypothetical protein
MALYTAADLSKNKIAAGSERKTNLLMLRDMTYCGMTVMKAPVVTPSGLYVMELLFSLRMERHCFCQANCLVYLR